MYFRCHKCTIRAVKFQSSEALVVLRLQTSGSVYVPSGLQCCIMFPLILTATPIQAHTHTHTETHKKEALAFCFSANWKSIEIHPPWKWVTFSRSLPMIRNKLCQRLSDIQGAGGCLQWSVKDQQRCIYALCCCSCCVCVCQCVCTCIYLSDQGHTLLWAAQPEALQEQLDKGGLFTIIMHLISAHQTLLPGLITRSLIQHNCLISLCCRCPRAIVTSSTTVG